MSSRGVVSRSRPIIATLAVMAVAAGCSAPATDRGDAPLAASPASVAPAAEGATRSVPAGPLPSLAGHVLAEVQRRGTIPFNNLMLPIVSPDGQYIATQVGRAPQWELLEGSPDVSVPYTSKVEIYELARAPSADPPRRIAVVPEGVVLGRSADDDGFIVEGPRRGGARWIGKADWRTGHVTWLVDDEHVNAFGCLGPDGRLAYCRREADAEFFSLVVRTPSEQWRLPGSGGDWVMPTYANGPDPDALFALVLRDGALDLVHFDASGQDRVRTTITSVPLADSLSTRETAYQIFSAHPVVIGPPRTRDAITFQHPVRSTAALWIPGQRVTLFDRPSFAVTVDPGNEDYVLLGTAKDLVRQPIDTSSGSRRSKLLKGLHVPRPTTDPARPFIIFAPDDGLLDVTVVRLLDPASLAGARR